MLTVTKLLDRVTTVGHQTFCPVGEVEVWCEKVVASRTILLSWTVCTGRKLPPGMFPFWCFVYQTYPTSVPYFLVMCGMELVAPENSRQVSSQLSTAIIIQHQMKNEIKWWWLNDLRPGQPLDSVGALWVIRCTSRIHQAPLEGGRPKERKSPLTWW